MEQRSVPGSVWQFCQGLSSPPATFEPSQGQLVPFASQTVPPSAVYTFPVPELAYPAPSIPRGSIQLAYTAGWRDKPPQGNSQGLFPGSKWRGGVDFNATVVVGPEERGSPYSWQGNEVYVHMQARMPVTVSTSGEVPPGSFVRAYLVFRDPSLKEVVQRCAKHQSEEKESPISEHWVRGHPDCCPVYGVADGVHYVDIPYDKLMGNTTTKWAVYSFHCYSSCVERTGLQRKRKATSSARLPPLRLMLQLVFGPQLQQLGRDGIDIRICACPGRDRGTDADRVRRKGKGRPTTPPSPSAHSRKHKGKGKAKAASSPSPKPQVVPSAVEMDMSIPCPKVERVSIDGREYYHLDMYVPTEKKDIKDAHLSLDLAARTI